MFRLKALSLLAGIVAVLAVSASPASAWWEAAKQLKGPIRVIQAGSFVDGEGAAKFVVKCPANEVVARWSIQTAGQIKIHEKEGKQEQTNLGPHLNIQVKSWGANCKAKIGEAAEVKAEVKACELQLVQSKGSFTATGGVVTECRIKAANCESIVPAGMEKSPESGEGINVGLKEAVLENITPNQLDKVNVTGVRAEKQANAGCVLTTVQKAELTGLEFEAEGVKAV